MSRMTDRGARAVKTGIMVVLLVAAPLGCSGGGDPSTAPQQPAGTPAAPSPLAPPPPPPVTITSIQPTLGPESGGTVVTFTGTGFLQGTSVTFGGTPATDVRVISSTSMTVVAPPHAAGAVDVAAANPGAGWTITLLKGYYYNPEGGDPCWGCWDY